MIKSEEKPKVYVNLTFFSRDAKERDKLLDLAAKNEIELIVQRDKKPPFSIKF